MKAIQSAYLFDVLLLGKYAFAAPTRRFEPLSRLRAI